MDRIKELELKVKELEAELLRRKGMVSQLEIMDDLQSQYEPLNSEGCDPDDDRVKDSENYGEAQDKLRELRGDKRDKVIVIDLNPKETTKQITLDEFNSQELLDELGLDTRWELFELIERINGKQIVTYMLGNEEVEESTLIVWNGSYLEFVNFYKIETIDLHTGGNK